NSSWGLASWPSTETWSSPITLEDCVYGFRAGNPIAAVIQIIAAMEKGTAISDSIPEHLRDYAVFHGLVLLLCVIFAVLRLRALALKQAQGPTWKVSRKKRLLLRPAMGNLPMLWKEI